MQRIARFENQEWTERAIVIKPWAKTTYFKVIEEEARRHFGKQFTIQSIPTESALVYTIVPKYSRPLKELIQTTVTRGEPFPQKYLDGRAPIPVRDLWISKAASIEQPILARRMVVARPRSVDPMEPALHRWGDPYWLCMLIIRSFPSHSNRRFSRHTTELRS
jgi:hypothetical protein